MQKTMKFHLVVEYETPIGELDINDVEKAHIEVFEDAPGDFINYLLSRGDASVEYGFEDDGLASDDFECEKYFYHKDSEDSHICRKYGALCGNVLCPSLK
jgi:hypothetical protein